MSYILGIGSSLINKGENSNWFRHLSRLDESNIAKGVFKRILEGRRGIGRHNLRWKHNVEEDYRKLVVNTS